jgi:hypothetical protein
MHTVEAWRTSPETAESIAVLIRDFREGEAEETPRGAGERSECGAGCAAVEIDRGRAGMADGVVANAATVLIAERGQPHSEAIVVLR